MFYGIITGMEDTIFRVLRGFIDYSSTILIYREVLSCRSVAFSSNIVSIFLQLIFSGNIMNQF